MPSGSIGWLVFLGVAGPICLEMVSRKTSEITRQAVEQGERPDTDLATMERMQHLLRWLAVLLVALSAVGLGVVAVTG